MGIRGEIQVQDVTKRYGDDPTTTAALEGVNLSVQPGEFIALVGASGCGKSTLLRMIAGFEIPTGGRIEISGSPANGPGPDRGVVFQDYGLFPWLTASENVAFGPRRRGRNKSEARSIAQKMLERVGLARFSDRYPAELSGGMQQRVAIARVLANEPQVLLMDEPFGALDALTRSEMQVQLRSIHRDAAATIVFVTHSIEEAVFLADRVIVMVGGASHGLPGRIEKIVTIDLPSDRDVNSPEFNDLERRISDLVHLRPTDDASAK